MRTREKRKKKKRGKKVRNKFNINVRQIMGLVHSNVYNISFDGK